MLFPLQDTEVSSQRCPDRVVLTSRGFGGPNRITDNVYNTVGLDKLPAQSKVIRAPPLRQGLPLAISAAGFGVAEVK